MYTFTNQFGGTNLRQRVGMMNGKDSGSSVWWRYGLWILMMGAMACCHEPEKKTHSNNALPNTSPTRTRVLDLEDKQEWYRHLALFQSRLGTQIVLGNPVILQIKEDQFLLPDDYKFASDIYVNGIEVPAEELEKISPEFVRELFVMHQFENLVTGKSTMKPYQILIQTSPQPVPFNGPRKRFFTLLQAASISKYPMGESFSFNMNQLLEATFFHNKNAIVERTKDEHLRVYDEYAKNIDIFINNLPAAPDDVQTIHVREIARLYTRERPYTEWFRADNPKPRFELFIQTAPKRAKRDSSYYVFSPFYSGDF